MGPVREYYERRAFEYDDWYAGTELFAARIRPGWEQDVAALVRMLAALPPTRVLDVACGTGFLTRHLRGEVLGLDQSESMLRRAREQAPAARLVRGDALALPFPDACFGRVFVGHFYGHLLPDERTAFLAEARAVGGELVVVDAGLRGGEPRDEWQERVLKDGSRHRLYKRYFSADGLCAELGGGRVLFDGHWFVAVAAALAAPGPAPSHQNGWGD